MERRRVDRRRRFLPREQGRGVGDAGPNAIEQVVASGIISAIQGVTEGHVVSRTVALEDEPAQPQQGSAVVPAVIKAPFKRF